MNRLLERHYDRLYAVCRRVAGNDADAADGCQEALMAIVRGLPRFDGRSTFRTWSYRVATNACLDELRRRNRRPVVVEEVPEAPSNDPGIDQRLADRLTLDDALGRLAEEFRVPIVLRDVAGFDYAEIAQTLDIPPGTVRSRIARGRRHLAGMLESRGAETPSAGNQSPTSRRPTD